MLLSSHSGLMYIFFLNSALCLIPQSYVYMIYKENVAFYRYQCLLLVNLILGCYSVLSLETGGVCHALF